MDLRWTGTVCMTERFLGYVGPLGRTEPHSHHAVQVALGLDGPICLRDGDGRTEQGQAAVIPRDVSHAIVEPTKQALLLYVNPENTLGRRIAALAIGERARSWFDAGEPLTHLLVSLPFDTPGELERAAEAVTLQLVGEAPRPAPAPSASRSLL